MRLQSFFTDPTIHRSFKGNNEVISSCIFTPNMKQSISGTENGNIFVWNFKPQMRPFKFSQHKGAITDLAINPLGDIIASSSTDQTVRLWTNAVKGKNQIIKAHPSPIRSVDFSSTGEFLMTGSNDKTIKIFELYPKIKFRSSYKGHSNWVRCARFSPDNRLIGSCGDDNSVIIFDVEQKSVKYRFLDHAGHVNSCRFSPDGTIIASSGDDGKIKLFDIRMGRLIQHYDAHNDKINCISYHQSGNYIISGSDDSTIKIWDLKMGQILYTVHGHRGKVKSVNFNIDGDYFCSGGEDSILMVWKSNIRNMDEEFNTLGKARMQNYTMTNKTKINLEESKQAADKNYLNNVKIKLDGGENIIKQAKIPNKAFGMRYKVILEKGVKDIFGLDNNYKNSNSNLNSKYVSASGNTNIQSEKNMIMNSNTNMNSKNNVVIEVSENPMNDSSMMLNPNLNPFSKLPTEMASAFDKMIQQFEIISKTVKIMDQRIATAESQIEGLYGMRKIQNELNNENGQEYNDNKENNNYIPDNNEYNNNFNMKMNVNNNLVNENNVMNEEHINENNNNINNEEMENNNVNNNEMIENNENNNPIIENDINQNQNNNNNIISSTNNNVNNINNNMTANFNATITGLQASIGDLDINVNDARNIFNQNLGNTNLNMENHEEINQNLNSNVNPIGSGEIFPEQGEVLNDVNVDDNNQNEEENK